jgi:FKBP-type peptidyl-prolyl cis-trans isomerase
MTLRSFVLLYLMSSTSLFAAEQSNAERGAEFLAANAQREGVVQTESGLQYMIIKPGNDVKPSKKSRVTLHYRGKNLDDKLFDRTYSGKPATFRLSKLIKGWTEGIQLIGEGGNIELFVPANLAYGRRGAPPAIGRNEVLLFSVQLLEVHQ